MDTFFDTACLGQNLFSDFFLHFSGAFGLWSLAAVITDEQIARLGSCLSKAAAHFRSPPYLELQAPVR